MKYRIVLLMVCTQAFSCANKMYGSIPDSSIYVSEVKEIFSKLFTTYNELKSKKEALEITTKVSITQSKSGSPKNESPQFETKTNESVSYVRKGLAILKNENQDMVYMSNSHTVRVDKENKIITIDKNKNPELIKEETLGLRKRYHNLVDTLINGIWNVTGNLLTIEKKFTLTDDIGIESIKVVVDLKEKQLVTQEVYYKNFFVQKIISQYSYNMSTEFKEDISISDLKKNKEYSNYKIIDNRSN